MLWKRLKAWVWCQLYCGYVRRVHPEQTRAPWNFTHYPECPRTHPGLWT